MPYYDYKCHTCDIIVSISHSMSDEESRLCWLCESPLIKLFSSVPVHFKGKGFHSVDKRGPFIKE